MTEDKQAYNTLEFSLQLNLGRGTKKFIMLKLALIVRAVEEDTMRKQADFNQGFQKCSFYREPPIFGATPECKGGGKREVTEKTRWPTASYGTIPTCGYAGVTPPGMEPGLPSCSLRSALAPRRSRPAIVLLAVANSLWEEPVLFPTGEHYSQMEYSRVSGANGPGDAGILRRGGSTFNLCLWIGKFHEFRFESRWGFNEDEYERAKKTRRPAASTDTIPTCENPGATPPGIEPGSLRWRASVLTTTLPRPL
ncbi:hypothetical protein PR048_030587 [Dryococelus australis]|uniref:Uncharacterized protein n=1 Tax=Dryococelus australis TaxID=614101 RepID=A0ABQ9GBY8_9NEOP|nr:hypothetical protein PR048_030587 [Dryococelus australis]